MNRMPMFAFAAIVAVGSVGIGPSTAHAKCNGVHCVKATKKPEHKKSQAVIRGQANEVTSPVAARARNQHQPGKLKGTKAHRALVTSRVRDLVHGFAGSAQPFAGPPEPTTPGLLEGGGGIGPGVHKNGVTCGGHRRHDKGHIFAESGPEAKIIHRLGTGLICNEGGRRFDQEAASAKVLRYGRWCIGNIEENGQTGFSEIIPRISPREASRTRPLPYPGRMLAFMLTLNYVGMSVQYNVTMLVPRRSLAGQIRIYPPCRLRLTSLTAAGV